MEKDFFEVIGNCLVIHAGKEIDHHSAACIREQADDCIMKNKVKNVIFDFGKTEFMDSSGIGVIMGRYRMVKNIGGKVGIVDAGERVKRIVLLSGLHKVVHTYDSLENAVEMLREEL